MLISRRITSGRSSRAFCNTSDPSTASPQTSKLVSDNRRAVTARRRRSLSSAMRIRIGVAGLVLRGEGNRAAVVRRTSAAVFELGFLARDAHQYFRAPASGLNRELAAVVRNTFAHSANAQSRALRLNLQQLFGRNALALILNFDGDDLSNTGNANRRQLAAGVTVNVGQTLLHDAEYHQLHFAGESAEVFRNFQRDIQPAALVQALNVPKQRSGKPGFVQKRRGAQIRRCSKVLLPAPPGSARRYRAIRERYAVSRYPVSASSDTTNPADAWIVSTLHCSADPILPFWLELVLPAFPPASRIRRCVAVMLFRSVRAR